MRASDDTTWTSSQAAAEPGRDGHLVQFYDSDEFLDDRVARFLDAGLVNGDVLLVISTPAQRHALRQRLVARGHDVDGAVAAGRICCCDASDTLGRIMDGDLPDWERFHHVLGAILDRCCADRPVTVRAYSQLVDLLWRSGNARGAVRLEQLWSHLKGKERK